MNNISPKLFSLATDLMQSLPSEAADLRGYINDISLQYIVENHVTTWLKPEPMPYYGPVFELALQAVENGWENRAAYHAERLAKAVSEAGWVLKIVNQNQPEQ